MPEKIEGWKCLACGFVHESEADAIRCEAQGEPKATYHIGQEFEVLRGPLEGKRVSVTGTFVRAHGSRHGISHSRRYTLKGWYGRNISGATITEQIKRGLWKQV